MLKFLAQMNASPVTYTIGLGGGHGNYPTRGIPAAWLISAEGKVVWQGGPGGLSGKLIEEELKKVKPTDEQRNARAMKILEAAGALVSEGKALQAKGLLDRVTKEFKGSEAAKAADEKLKELDRDETFKKELKAQQTLDKIVGGLELPKEKLNRKERDGKKVMLEAFIKKNREEAPAAAALAETWVKVMAEDWKAEK
ncbi:MAG: hypothetical protein L6R43_06920 [Planctomycetes bacterium]|nr:hypothetical protein [Planctomycetota bacterium]